MKQEKESSIKSSLPCKSQEPAGEYDCNDVPLISPSLVPRVLLLQMIHVFIKTKKK